MSSILIYGFIIFLTVLYAINEIQYVNKFDIEFGRLTKDFMYNDLDSLQTFSWPINYTPLQQTIVITNQHDCTPTKPRICKLDDITTCIGCKNLLSKCVHINVDQKFKDINGEEGILKANKPDEGYCLDIVNPNQKCNPYHGELVLVSHDKFSSILLCLCKNPGLIGNLTLDGSCETQHPIFLSSQLTI